MRKSFKVFTIAIAVVAFTYTAYFLAGREGHDNALAIPNEALDGFDKCEVSDKLNAIKSKLIKHGKPSEKKEGIWVYPIAGQVMGFPVSHIEIGVCNDRGDRNCGWGIYTGFAIDTPMQEVRKTLISKYGVDYTVEKREKENDVTLRPLLSSWVPEKNAILFCDPGSL